MHIKPWKVKLGKATEKSVVFLKFGISELV